MARYTGPITTQVAPPQDRPRRRRPDLRDAAPSRPASTAARRIKEKRVPARSCRRSRRPASPTACMEKQFRRYYEEAARRVRQDRREPAADPGVAASTTSSTAPAWPAPVAHARQLVTHGHFLVNGVGSTCPSYRVAQYDIIDVRQESAEHVPVRARPRDLRRPPVPAWLQVVPGSAAILDPPAARARADRHAAHRAADRRVLLEELTPARAGRPAVGVPATRTVLVGAPGVRGQMRGGRRSHAGITRRQIAVARGKEEHRAHRTAPHPLRGGHLRRTAPGSSSSRSSPASATRSATRCGARCCRRIPGAAVTSIRIDGVLHEFTTDPRGQGGRHRDHPEHQGPGRLLASTTSRSPCTCASRAPATSPPPTSRRRPASRCTTPTCTSPR